MAVLSVFFVLISRRRMKTIPRRRRRAISAAAELYRQRQNHHPAQTVVRIKEAIPIPVRNPPRKISHKKEVMLSQISDLKAKGYSYQSIADRLGLHSRQSVAYYVKVLDSQATVGQWSGDDGTNTEIGISRWFILLIRSFSYREYYFHNRNDVRSCALLVRGN